MRGLVALLALVACKDDGKKRQPPETPYTALAACGIGYQLPDGWKVSDPATVAEGWLRIDDLHAAGSRDFDESQAVFTGPGVRVSIACSPQWNQALPFDEHLVEAQRERTETGVLMAKGLREITLASDHRLSMLVVVDRRGVIEHDQRPVVGGFGGLEAGGKYILVGFGGIAEETDLDAIEAFLETVTLP